MNGPISRREAFRRGATSLAALGAATGAKSSAISPLDTAHLAELIDGLLARSGVPGLSLAIVNGGRLVHAEGYGFANVQRAKPVTPRTIFQAASLTKPMFAQVAMKLCELGRLGLDSPVVYQTPGSSISSDPRIERVTTRMCLSHSSGLPNWVNGRRPMDLDFAPGAMFGYSSEAYNYLQEAVEHIFAAPLESLMWQYVVSPADLRESYFVWQEQFDSTAAVGYEWDGTPVKSTSKPTKAGAASTLHTTPSDFAKFMMHVMSADVPDGAPIDKVTRRMILSPQVHLTPNLAWGLGWGLEMRPQGDRFWHFGDSRGFMSYAIASPSEEVAVVIFTNGRHGLRVCEQVAEYVMGDQASIFRWIYDVFYEGELRSWPSVSPSTNRTQKR